MNASDPTGSSETTTTSKNKTSIGATGVAFQEFAMTGTTDVWMPTADIKTICIGTPATRVQTNNTGLAIGGQVADSMF